MGARSREGVVGGVWVGDVQGYVQRLAACVFDALFLFVLIVDRFEQVKAERNRR